MRACVSAVDVAGLSVNMALNPATGQLEAFDFKGNLLRSSRQFVSDPKALTDWNGAAPPLLTAWVASTTFDALNRATALTSSDGSVTTPTYNERNALKALSLNLRGASSATPFVTDMITTQEARRCRSPMRMAGPIRRTRMTH